ncbi:MAG: sialidase family protein [Planctomycetia bacterium]|nr:sialidase family protein [Planctomycetia bacterium]
MKRRLTRRDFLSHSALAVSAVGLSPYVGKFAFGQTSTPNFEILEEARTFSMPPDFYYGWPTVGMRDGELFVVTSGGREGHVCPFGRVDMFRSKDLGKTWTWPQTLYDSPIDDRDAGICVTNQGTILVTTFTSMAYESLLNEETSYRERGEARLNIWSDGRYEKWMAVHRRLNPEERKKEIGSWMLRSTDAGLTWSERYATHFNSPHGPIQLSDGRLLYMGTELWTEEHNAGAEISEDDGLTWKVAGIVPVRDGDSAQGYHELHAAEATDGTIVALIRNENPNNSSENLQTVSKDGGKTWSVPRSIGVWGIPAHLIRLQDGRILMTYGHRRAPIGVQARVSEDAGESWSDPLILYGDAADGDMGYPSSVQLPDGSIFTVWYEHMTGSWFARLRCARWSIKS